MKITIEFDANSTPEIKNVALEDDKQQTLSPSPQGIDAGSAHLYETQKAMSEEGSIAEMANIANSNKLNGINAGAYRPVESGTVSESPSAHDNHLLQAGTTPQAIDAGAAKIYEADPHSNINQSTDTTINVFDRSKAISAGEFKESITENPN